MITNAQIARWNELLAAATPGPWRRADKSTHIVVGPHRDGHGITGVCEVSDYHDLALIAAARDALPELIAEIKAHRARASGICSAHQHAEDPSCETCYGSRTRLRELEGALVELEHATVANGCPICQPVNKWGHTSSCPVGRALPRRVDTAGPPEGA